MIYGIFIGLAIGLVLMTVIIFYAMIYVGGKSEREMEKYYQQRNKDLNKRVERHMTELDIMKRTKNFN